MNQELNQKCDLILNFLDSKDLKDEIESFGIIKSLFRLSGDTFWIKNQNHNITVPFKNRSFRIPKDRFSKEDYLKNIHKNFGFVDESSTYYQEKVKIDPLNYIRKNPGKLNLIFGRLNHLGWTKIMSYLFHYILTTWHYSDAVIKNPRIMTLMCPIIKDNPKLTAYAMTYYFYVVYKIECYWKGRMKLGDRCVFSLSEARLLPIFPKEYHHPGTSPYFPLSVDRSKNYLDYKNNIFGYYKTDKFKFGFASDQECYQNFCLFTSANLNNNGYTTVFEGVNMFTLCTGCLLYPHDCINCRNAGYIHRAIFCGSVMTFMLPKSDPTRNKVELLDEYKKSDIDIAVFGESYDDLLEFARNEIYPVVLRNLQKYNDVKEIEMIYPYFVTYMINTDFVKKYLEWDFDYLKKNCHKAIVKFVIHFIIKLLDKKLKFPELYNRIQYKDLADVKIFVVDRKLEKNFIVLENLRVHIKSDLLVHPIEIFLIKKLSGIGTIAKFHVPNVRAFYDLKTAYMTPSYISAVMTRCNMDFKYFFSKKNPLDTIQKSIKREFGYILNLGEKKHLQNHTGTDYSGYSEYGIDNFQYIERNPLYWKLVGKLVENNILYPVDQYGNLKALEPGLLELGKLFKKIN